MKNIWNKALAVKLVGLLILISAFAVRYYGQNWDSGLQLHPDERAIVMFAEKLHFFDNLNPGFFSYGSLPIYLLRAITQLVSPADSYMFSFVAGRTLSVVFDCITVLLTGMIAARLFRNNVIALQAMAIYAFSFFPIQNSHFYVVDVPLTMCVSIMLILILRYLNRPSGWNVFLLSVITGTTLAIKITPVIFVPFILAIIWVAQLRIHKGKKAMLKALLQSMTYIAFAQLVYVLLVPYSILDSTKYLHDMTEQLGMNTDPYTFPFTLQYVGTLPYLYYIKNIVLWGLGPVISFAVTIGIVMLVSDHHPFTHIRIRHGIKAFFADTLSFCRHHAVGVTAALFYMYYFVVIGRSAVKFMRYMLPLYPFFAVLAAYACYRLFRKRPIQGALFAALILYWTFTFVSIYTKPFTRMEASMWVHNHIPQGATIANEDWDDGLPMISPEVYQYQQMPMYDQPDNLEKWAVLQDRLAKSNYLAITSNRAYIPLSRLVDCNRYKQCYPLTSEYYRRLFADNFIGEGYAFKKVADFQVKPELPFSELLFGRPIYIDDQAADESFTVYDHPRVIIFKNTAR